MKQVLIAIFSIFICIQLTGCAVRTFTSTQPRVDQEIAGNRGFIYGRPTSSPKEPTFTERKVYKIEVELPHLAPKTKPASMKKEPKAKDKIVTGNRGYLFGGPPKEVIKERSKALSEEWGARKPSAAEIGEKTLSIPEAASEEILASRTYTVEKGDTLQKISQKFYGTTKKWSLLYEFNKDQLKSPDRVYPGQILVIPEVGEFKK